LRKVDCQESKQQVCKTLAEIPQLVKKEQFPCLFPTDFTEVMWRQYWFEGKVDDSTSYSSILSHWKKREQDLTAAFKSMWDSSRSIQERSAVVEWYGEMLRKIYEMYERIQRL